MPTRILITGGGFVNKGAEAMTRAVQAFLLPAVPDACGYLRLQRDGIATAEDLHGLRPWHCTRQARLKRSIAHHAGLLRGRRGRALASRLSGGLEFDLSAVVDISGYAVGNLRPPGAQSGSGWSKASLNSLVSRLMTRDWTVFHSLGIPLYYLPQAWGPFDTREAVAMGEQVLRSAALAFARDAQSYEALQGLRGFSPQKVRQASDIAFLFKGADPEEGHKLLAQLGLRVGEAPLVGIVPNMRVYERLSGQGTDNPYVQGMTAVTRHFLGLGCQVALMPHEIALSDRGTDDRFLCRLIAQAAAAPGRAVAVCEPCSAEQLKAMIGHMELLVSSRFHSLVAALSLRRPVVAVSWSHKYHELLGSVGLGDYVLGHRDLTPGGLIELCQQGWEEREASRVLLDQHVPTHERSARAALDEVTAMIREGCGDAGR